MYRALKIIRTTALGLLLGMTGVFLINGAGKVSAVDLPVQYVSDMDTNQTWMNDKVYYVQGDIRLRNAVLTIEPGTIVKYAQDSAIYVESGSVVQATGTSTDPINFTSYKDDALGGDSNGDGLSQGTLGDYSAAFLSGGGSINIHFSLVQFGSRAINGTGCGQGVGVTLSNNILKSGISLNCDGSDIGDVSLERNLFDLSSSRAVELSYIDPSGITLSGANSNVFTGAGQGRVVQLLGTPIQVGKIWTVAGSNGAVLLPQQVPIRGQLNLQPGAIVKSQEVGFYAEQGGQLNAVGSSTSEVVFTSYQDDTQGGDSNGNGHSVAGTLDYQAAIRLSAGTTVNVAHAKFKAASHAVVGYYGICDGANVYVVDSNFAGAITGCAGLGLSLQRNHFEVLPETPAIGLGWSDPSQIILSGANRNTFAGAGRARVIELSNSVTIPAGKTWTVAASSDAVVEGTYINIEGTLKLEAGSVVKGSNSFLNVRRGGRLIAEGTATNRVVFTSITDDRYAGDTNNDGPSDPYSPYYEVAIKSLGGTIDVSYALFDGMNFSASDGCFYEPDSGPLQITDSVMRSALNVTNCAANSLVLARNSFEVRDNYYPAVTLMYGDASGIALAGSDQNTFTGSGRSKVVSVAQQANVPVGKIWTVAGSSGAVLEADLQVRGTLNLQEGAIVKAGGSGGIKAVEGGNVNVQGSANDKVTFTSYKDDSVGGDSNGDGASVASNVDLNAMLAASGTANLTIVQGVFKEYAIFAVDVNCALGASAGIYDSTIRSQTYVNYCGDGAIVMERNHFEATGQQQALSTCGTEMAGIVLAGTNRNVFSGSGPSRVVSVSAGYIAAGRTWSVDGSSNAVVALTGNACGNNGPGVTLHGTLHLGPGAIFKHSANGAINVGNGGTLDTDGVANDKVLITSFKDDNAGGDSNADGQSSGGAADYTYGINALAGSTVTAANATVRYASIAVLVNDADVRLAPFEIDTVSEGIDVSGNQSRVVYRGSIHNVSGKSVRSCSWATATCGVNVAFTDWGDSQGPYPFKVCGQMIATPWKYNGQVVAGASLFMLDSCSEQNSAPQYHLDSATFTFEQRRAMLDELCNDQNQQDACEAWERNDQCIRNGIIPIAEAHYGIPMPTQDPATQALAYGGAMGDGFTDYVIGADSDINYTQSLDALTKFKDAAETMVAVAQAYRVCSQ